MGNIFQQDFCGSLGNDTGQGPISSQKGSSFSIHLPLEDDFWGSKVGFRKMSHPQSQQVSLKQDYNICTIYMLQNTQQTHTFLTKDQVQNDFVCGCGQTQCIHRILEVESKNANMWEDGE